MHYISVIILPILQVLEEYDITEDGTLQTSTVDDDTITNGQLGVDSHDTTCPAIRDARVIQNVHRVWHFIKQDPHSSFLRGAPRISKSI